MSEYIPDDLDQIRANMLSDFKPRTNGLSCSACDGKHNTQREVKQCCVSRGADIVAGVREMPASVPVVSINGVDVSIAPDSLLFTDADAGISEATYYVGQRLINGDRNMTIEIMEIDTHDFKFKILTAIERTRIGDLHNRHINHLNNYGYTLLNGTSTPKYYVGQRLANDNNVIIEILELIGDYDFKFKEVNAMRDSIFEQNLIFIDRFGYKPVAVSADDAPVAPKFYYDIPIGNYIAMDRNGNWAQYTNEPVNSVYDDYWVGDYVGVSIDSRTPSWHDWEDSLFLMTEQGLTHVKNDG